MKNEYWLNKWQTNDISFHENVVNPDLITYIEKLNLKSGDNILVPLCGKTKDMLWLADQGLHVFGIEISPIACQDFFSEMNISPEIKQFNNVTKFKYKNITLLCGDLFDITKNDFPKIHAVYDCKALIALPSDVRVKYVNHIISCVGTDIRILLHTRETTCEVSPPPYPVEIDEIKILYGKYFKIERLKYVSINEIPERLVNKGYTEMKEAVYLIAHKL